MQTSDSKNKHIARKSNENVDVKFNFLFFFVLSLAFGVSFHAAANNSQSFNLSISCPQNLDTEKCSELFKNHINQNNISPNALTKEQLEKVLADAIAGGTGNSPTASKKLVINITNDTFSNRPLNKKTTPAATSLFQRCERLIPEDTSWPKVIKMKTADVWADAWKNFGYNQQRNLHSINEKKVERLVDFYKEFGESFTKISQDIAKCEAMRTITSYSEITEDSLKSGKTSVARSVDGKVVCKSAGIETQDYKSCLNALNAYNAALVGTAVFTQVQTVKYQGDSLETAGSLNPNDPTAALKAQKGDIESRAQLTSQRAGLDVAKATGLGIMMKKMPDNDDIFDYCKQNSKNNYRPIFQKFEQMKNHFSNLTKSAQVQISSTGATPGGLVGLDPETKRSLEKIDNKIESEGLLAKSNMQSYCKHVVDSNRKLIFNTAARDAIKNAMILAGIDGVKHKVTADQLNKQANQVGKVIDEVDNFDPSELPQFQGQDFQGSECELNPSAEGCDEFVQERSFGFQDTSPIQIHGIQNASSFKRGERGTNTNQDDDDEGPTGPSGAPKTVGSFDRKVAQDSGFKGRIPPAANVKSDGPAAAGGGGGGGAGAAGGGGSPPASQVQQPKNDQGPRMNNAGNSRAAYSGGGGSLRRSGGSGAMGRDRRSDDEGNPFEKLFGDKDPTQSESLTFNGRETASTEGQINTPDTSIFEIISDRYANVQKQDRLLEYKIKNAEELQ